MIDVLLIQPPIQDFYLTAKRTIPYGLACIASSLIQAGFSVGILDGLATSKSKPIPLPEEMAYLNEFYGYADISPFSLFHQYRHFGYSFEHIRHQVKLSGAFLIGISSLFTAYSQEALLTAEAVKRHYPDCRIVMGGHHPTAMPETVMACPSVDFVIRGDGEAVMPHLAMTLRDKKQTSHLPGVVCRNPDGTIHMTAPVYMDNLDSFPPPAIHLTRQSYYQRHGKSSAVIMSSRGCPMTCSYCCFGKESQTPYRRKRVSTVIREIETAISIHHAGFIDFEDENLSLDRDGFMEILKGVLRQTREGNDPVELRTMNGLFPPSLDAEMIQLMKAAGFKALNLSLGSVCPDQLRRFSRPDVKTAFENCLNWAETAGMSAVGYIIVAAPDQNPYDSLEDLLYLAEKRVLVGTSVFYPAPGSLDFLRCQKMGLLPDHLSLFRSTALPVSHTTTRLQAATLLRLSRILNFIKALMDQGITLADIMSSSPGPGQNSREETGLNLLRLFLTQGKINGMTPEGDRFEHTIDLMLTQAFVNRLHRLSIKGATAPT